MATVTLDTIENYSGTKVYCRPGQVGWEFTRGAVVSGLAPSEDTQLCTDAVTALIAVVGDVGHGVFNSEHPLAILREFRPEALDQTTVKVTMVYKEITGGPADIEVGAGLSQVESNLDAHGNPINLTYTYPANYTTNPARAGTTVPQGGMFQRLVPEANVTIHRTEYESPLVKATQYVGKVNSDYFMGLEPRRWMCTSITGRSEDGGWTWDVTYCFQAREDTWDETVVFINPDDGKPPPELVYGPSMKKPECYLAANFASGLNL